MARKRAAARDLEIPKRVNTRRRNRTKHSLQKFKETYFGHLAYMKTAPFLIDRLKKIQSAVKHGGQEAAAEPRGSGKTTDALIAAIWALVHGHKRFFYIIKANAKEAERIIDDFKIEAETNDLLLADFPEIFLPFRALDGAPQRAGRQTVNGIRTRVEYKQDYIIFPSVKGSLASGAVLAANGIDGTIRGKRINNLRPDFVLLDDIETPESVNSYQTTQNIHRKITADVGGLAAPGVSLSILFRGTIMADQAIIAKYTDRGQHPEWSGTRTKAIICWPNRMDLWKKYHDIKSKGIITGEDMDGKGAIEFYLANRAEMDDGAVVAWPDNYIRDDVDGVQLEHSNLQHLFNKIWKMGMDGFLTEYQNEPKPVTGYELTIDGICNRLNGIQQHRCRTSWRLVQFIDVRKTELHYVVLAVSGEMSGAFIDYGVTPLREIEGSSLDPRAIPAIERAIYDGLVVRRNELAQFPYQTVEGHGVDVELTVIDSGWMPEPVYKFVAESGDRFRVSKGQGFRNVSVRPGDQTTRRGQYYLAKYFAEGRVWIYHLDADSLKHAVHNRFRQGVDTSGAFTLFGSNPHVHREFAEHIMAESWDEERRKWIKVAKNNHFLDGAAGCIAASEMIGLRIIEVEPEPELKPIALGELMGKNRRRRP